MPATNRTALILSLVAAAVFSVACVKDAPTVLNATVSATQDVNPGPAGRPSPIVVRFYALKSLKAFDTAALHAKISRFRQPNVPLPNWESQAGYFESTVRRTAKRTSRANDCRTTTSCSSTRLASYRSPSQTLPIS